jgi:hypothetical protein
MGSSKKRKPGRTSRKSPGQKSGLRKPRGSQGSVPGGDLGSPRERDAALRWTKGLMHGRAPDLRDAIPELAGYGDDDDVLLVFSTGPEQPEDAGPLIGELNVAATLDDGTVMPPGTRVWLSSRDAGDIARNATSTLRFGDLPAALAGEPVPPGPESKAVIPREMSGAANAGLIAASRDQRGQLPRAGEPGFSPDLAARLARGLSPEELADPDILRQIAAGAAGAGPGMHSFTAAPRPSERDDIIHDYSLSGLPQREVIPSKIVIGGNRTDDEPGLPYGMQPGDVIADEQPLGFTETGIKLPGGGEIRPGAKVWRADAAGTIPDQSSRLDERVRALVPGSSDQSALIRTREAAEAVIVRTRWPGDLVKDQHAWLEHHYRNPSGDLADYLAFNIRNSLAQDHRTASMFWPVDLTSGADVPQGRQLAQLIARGLGDARSVQVESPMIAKMRAEQEARPTGTTVLDEGWLPCAAGFAWLDTPWLQELAAGYWLPVRAVSWERTAALASSDHGAAGLPADGLPAMIDSVRIVLWLLISDDVAFGRWEGEESRAEKVANRVGRLIPQQVVLLPFGARINMIGGRLRTNGEQLMGLVRTLWKYLGELLPKSRVVRPAAPAVARRVSRSLKHSELHIITLRQYDYIGEPEPHFPSKIDWRGRWWVDEFYRHIDHYDDGADEKGRRRRHQAMPAQRSGYVTDDDHDVCAVCLANGHAIRIALIHTFAKGPANKPFLRPSRERTLYKLAR